MKHFAKRLKLKTAELRKLSAYCLWGLSGRKKKRMTDVYYVSEGSDWVIERIGSYISGEVDKKKLIFNQTHSPRYIKNSILHYGSMHAYLQNRLSPYNESNKLIVTVFHGDKSISAEWRDLLDSFLADKDKYSKIVVSNTIMKNRMLNWGIMPQKLAFIPIGIDLSSFSPLSGRKKRELRRKFAIPEDAFCIGSFQKDGIGWGEGMSPKPVKGPDIFVKVVAALADKRKIHVLLTGPSRGFVKKELEKTGIGYSHFFVKDHSELNDLYNCLDLYIVASREEGGPKALMESMASGIPLVTTAVGMAPDLIKNNNCGIMVEVNDVDSLISAAEQVIRSESIRENIVNNGFKAVKNYDWTHLAKQYDALYKEVACE